MVFLKLRMRPSRVLKKRRQKPQPLLEGLPFNFLFWGRALQPRLWFYVLFLSLLFSMSHRSDPQIGLLVMSLVSALPLLVSGHVFSRWGVPGCLLLEQSHTGKNGPNTDVCKMFWGLVRWLPAPREPESGLYIYGVEARRQGSGPVSSSGTVLGACISLSACFLCFPSNMECAPGTAQCSMVGAC